VNCVRVLVLARKPQRPRSSCAATTIDSAVIWAAFHFVECTRVGVIVNAISRRNRWTASLPLAYQIGYQRGTRHASCQVGKLKRQVAQIGGKPISLRTRLHFSVSTGAYRKPASFTLPTSCSSYSPEAGRRSIVQRVFGRIGFKRTELDDIVNIICIWARKKLA
jgi:hypothetical protein